MSLCFTRPLSLPGGGVFNQIYRSSWINPPERPYHFRPPQAISHSIVDDETHTHTHTETKDIYGWLEAAKMRCQALAGMLQCAMFIYLLFFWTLVVGQCHARRTAYRAPTHSLPLIGLIRNDRRMCVSHILRDFPPMRLRLSKAYHLPLVFPERDQIFQSTSSPDYLHRSDVTSEQLMFLIYQMNQVV